MLSLGIHNGTTSGGANKSQLIAKEKECEEEHSWGSIWRKIFSPSVGGWLRMKDILKIIYNQYGGILFLALLFDFMYWRPSIHPLLLLLIVVPFSRYPTLQEQNNNNQNIFRILFHLTFWRTGTLIESAKWNIKIIIGIASVPASWKNESWDEIEGKLISELWRSPGTRIKIVFLKVRWSWGILFTLYIQVIQNQRRLWRLNVWDNLTLRYLTV